MRFGPLVSIPLFAFALTSRALADPAEPRPAKEAAPPPPYALANTGALFLGLEFVGSATSFAILSVAAGDPASECGWCVTNAFDRAVRNGLRAGNPRLAATFSHVLSVGAAPLLAFGAVTVPAFHADKGSYALADATIIVNSFVLSTGFVDFTKKLAARERPAFHYGVEAETEARHARVERFLSFYSGDTAWAFSLASSASTLSYLRGYPSAPYVAAGGAAIGFATGALRVAADMHWATDVLAGALIGTASGALLPLALHRRESKHAALPIVLPRASRAELGFELVWTEF